MHNNYPYYALTLVIGEGDRDPWYTRGGESGGETPVETPSGVKVRMAGEEPRCP